MSVVGAFCLGSAGRGPGQPTDLGEPRGGSLKLPDDDALDPILRLTPEPPPLPEPANTAELDALDLARRIALHDRQHCRDLITALDHSIARCRAQLAAERQGVAEAELVLRSTISCSGTETCY